MNLDYEYIVLGLGGFGSAAAHWLARRVGAEVLGLEQFELGHVRGESQDHSRIIRLSYHEPHYVELAKHAYRAWAEVERDAGEQLVLKTGGLDLGPRESAISLANYSDSLDADQDGAGGDHRRTHPGRLVKSRPRPAPGGHLAPGRRDPGPPRQDRVARRVAPDPLAGGAGDRRGGGHRSLH